MNDRKNPLWAVNPQRYKFFRNIQQVTSSTMKWVSDTLFPTSPAGKYQIEDKAERQADRQTGWQADLKADRQTMESALSQENLFADLLTDRYRTRQYVHPREAGIRVSLEYIHYDYDGINSLSIFASSSILRLSLRPFDPWAFGESSNSWLGPLRAPFSYFAGMDLLKTYWDTKWVIGDGIGERRTVNHDCLFKSSTPPWRHEPSLGHLVAPVRKDNGEPFNHLVLANYISYGPSRTINDTTREISSYLYSLQMPRSGHIEHVW